MSNKMKALLYPVDFFSYIREESSFISPVSSLKRKILHSLKIGMITCFHLNTNI